MDKNSLSILQNIVFHRRKNVIHVFLSWVNYPFKTETHNSKYIFFFF